MDQKQYVFILYLLNIIFEHKGCNPNAKVQMSQTEGLCLVSTTIQCVYTYTDKL